MSAADPAAWRADAIGGRSGLERRLTSEEVSALVAAARATGGRPPEDVRREDFAAPPIAALAAGLRHALHHGRGAMLLSGLDPAALPGDLFARIFRGLGAHLGEGAIQGPDGGRIARVEKADNPTGRGTLSDVELGPHTDMHELMALACVSKAAEGGESMLVSAPAVHDRLAATRPELLPALYEGYWAGVNPAVGGEKPVSDAKVPIFSRAGGRLSCSYNRYFMHAAAQHLGEALPDALERALAAFDAVAAEEGLGARFMLEPGEMLFWHNWSCLHARTAFRDAPGARRLLLRLWINAVDGRDVHPAVAQRARTMDADHRAAMQRRAARP